MRDKSASTISQERLGKRVTSLSHRRMQEVCVALGFFQIGAAGRNPLSLDQNARLAEYSRTRPGKYHRTLRRRGSVRNAPLFLSAELAARAGRAVQARHVCGGSSVLVECRLSGGAGRGATRRHGG